MTALRCAVGVAEELNGEVGKHQGIGSQPIFVCSVDVQADRI